jgi:hypothetical protein
VILISYDYRKACSIGVFGCVSIYKCITGVLLRQYFKEDKANDRAVGGVFIVFGELCVDMGRPQPRGGMKNEFC